MTVPAVDGHQDHDEPAGPWCRGIWTAVLKRPCPDIAPVPVPGGQCGRCETGEAEAGIADGALDWRAVSGIHDRGY